MADKSAYVPPEAFTGNGGIKKDASDVDLDDVDFFAKPAAGQTEKKPITPPPVVIPPPPASSPAKTPEPPKKAPIVYKKSTTYQKTFAGPRK
uniref:Calpain inhibitor n=1 Tax=Strongyloides papillosus TaxID=174720 RepID=A0A0N5BKH4_STREA